MSVPSGQQTDGVFIPLTVNNLLPSVDEETIGAFFNSAWFRAVDVEFAEEELSLLPISSVQRQADSGGGCTIWCRSKAVAEVVLTRLKGISYQGRTLEIFKLAGKPVPLDQLQPSALDRLVRSHDKKVALAKQNGDEVSHVSRATSLNGTPNAPCFYDVLKIDRAAEGREIKEAYVKLRRDLDPLGAAPSDLGRIVEAYETLSDPLKRNVYDHRPLKFWQDAKKAKEQKDRRPAMWVLKHSNDIKNGRVRRVRCTDRQAQTLIQQARNILTRVRGADLLVVAPLFPEVWISGNPQQLRNVEQMLKEASEEADGLRAPADGVVLKVPPVHAPKLPELGEKRNRFVEEIKAKTHSMLSFCEDRIIIRGGQVPVAVAWIQGRVLWRAEITCYDGSKMDGWQYSLSAERALHANPELVPDREPDVDEVEAILRSESPQGTTAERALHALDAIFRGRSAMSFTLLRLLTSKVVYHAVEQDQNIVNQFIVTVVRTWSKFNLQRPLYEFHKNSLLTILWKVPHVIVPYAGRYEQHLTSAIPTGQWVSWRQFLDTPGSPARLWLYQFLTDSAKACNFGVDEKWCQDHHICSFMLHYALGRYCHVDDQHGLCKRELVWFQGQAVPPVQPPVPQAPAFPQAPSTTSKAKPPTPPEATKANGPSPAQAEPRRSESVSRSRSRPPAKIPVKAKLDMSGHWKDLTSDKAVTLRPAQAVELLLFAAEKKDHFRKGHLLGELARNIAKSGAGSVEGLCRLLEGKSLDLLQAISTLEKIAAVSWDEQTLLALLHAGLHEQRQKEDVSSTLSLLDNVVEVPWKDFLLREDCSVIPFLAESGDRRVQRKLCQVVGHLEGTSAVGMFCRHKEAVMASLEAAASTAPGFSILSHVVKCFQSAGFDTDRMMTCVAGAFHRISKAGIEHMSDIWREVSRCVQMEVPEAMDCTLQHFRGFGSLHRFTDDHAPAEVTIFLCGAAVRLDAQEVWRTDAFKEERLKKLEVRQLLSCLKALLGTGREEQRVFFKAALQKNNEVNFTAVEALLFVQVAHELKEVAELAQHQKIINRAIEQDSLVDCVKVLQTLVEHGISNLEKVSKGTAQRIVQIAQQMSSAQLENHLLELRAAVQLLHQQGYLSREQQTGQQRFAERMSALRNLREVASKQRCNDLCIAQIIAMFLSDPKSTSRSSKKTLELAELLCGVITEQKENYPPETECSLLVRVTGNDKAAQQILPGVYSVVGKHDGCSVYQRVVPHMDKTNAVYMYYWSEQHQWYVGPSVGSDSVWAYADGAKSSTRPPRRNWHWQKPLENQKKLIINISVFCFEAGPAPGPTQAMPKTKAAVPQAKSRPHEPGNSAVQANVEPPTKKARPEVPPKNRAFKPGAKMPMPSPPSAAPEQVENENQRKCMEWLKGLDKGKGEFVKYFEKLKEHYDADLDNIKLARFEDEEGRQCIEKTFYEDIEAIKGGHQMIFRKHIWNIP
ncbi:unnamed protein product [Cladocopium goreaui]|uniref:J domain-containing protein n=1 Tax=Cladocopium goreaui TaxID=2562237 RepID=A0A9P1M3C4_9DINO|nr:unnamed protein product [Cladocopium goreaui]